MKELQKVLSRVRQAVQHYGMIQKGDRIAVGVSGGKDSMVLLYALSEMRRFYPEPYEVVAVTVDMGFGGDDFEGRFAPVSRFCEGLGVELHVVHTEIARIVFEERREENPCSLCAMLRRGALNNTCGELGCGKLALGHHKDDVVETFMMNLMHEGRIGCFEPVTEYSNIGLTVIRPLCYTEERMIKALVTAAKVPVAESICPEDGHTEREVMHDFLMSFEREHRGTYRRMFGALERRGIDGWYEEKPHGEEETAETENK
ncbi:MAG: tRNA 2-thiocytidine biosynthesis protein TtcA [Ruminococcaceae bacterium]|nr:tRNA 2-thiocytidine biosynthesis protein TtcA [Oscillospiraceae bacterium]